jgi:3-carboxy-cis,cis-muconate cycloisomerase
MRRPLLDVMLSDETVESLLSDDAQLGAMLRVETALAQAEAEVGLISQDAADHIASTLAVFEPDWGDLAEGLARDGVVVPRLVAQLRRMVGAEHSAAVHKGTTSQDIIDTALMLQLMFILDHFAKRLGVVLDLLETLIARDGGRAMQAHTRMQVALPFTVGAKVATWITPLREYLGSIAALRPRLALQLGGPIGDRSSFEGKGDTIAAALAERLGLPDSAPWHSNRSRIIDIGHWLVGLTGTLGKIGADVVLLAQTEIHAVELDEGGTSSAMPHKSNPVTGELLVSLAHHNAVLVSALYQAQIHEHERSGTAWTLEWLTLPQMLRNAGGALRLTERLLATLRFT